MTARAQIELTGYGKTPTTIACNELYLDVGGVLRAGVIDHHLGLEEFDFPSTARMLLTLLQNPAGEHWPSSLETAQKIQLLRDSPDEVVIKTHRSPDFDAAVSCCLLIRYLDRKPIPDSIEKLVDAVDRADQGCFDDHPLANDIWYLFYWYLTEVNENQPSLHRFFSVIDQSLSDPLSPLVPKENHPLYRECASYLAALSGKYADHFQPLGISLPFFDDESSRFAQKGLVYIPLDDELRRNLQALKVLFRRTSDAIWAVQDPAACHGLGRLTLSVDGRLNYGLLGYGWTFEFLEKSLRRKLMDWRYPSRGGALRPGYRNADPWYDGRGHHCTIVDSPNSGTILNSFSKEDIIALFGRLKDCWPRLMHTCNRDRLTLAVNTGQS